MTNEDIEFMIIQNIDYRNERIEELRNVYISDILEEKENYIIELRGDLRGNDYTILPLNYDIEKVETIPFIPVYILDSVVHFTATVPRQKLEKLYAIFFKRVNS